MDILYTSCASALEIALISYRGGRADEESVEVVKDFPASLLAPFADCAHGGHAC